VGEGENERIEYYSYVVPTEDNRYFMDRYKTGNVFLLYPNCEDDISDTEIGIKQWGPAQQQNRDAAAHPSLGLYFNSKYTVNVKHMQVINAISAAIEEKVINGITDENRIRQIRLDLSGEYRSLTLKTDGKDMPTYILNLIGEDVMLGETAITAEELSAALVYMGTTAIDKNATEQSPNALYTDWKENSGVNAKE
jgi:hypothetical protein